MTANPLRVLHVIGAMDRGGAETLVMNLYRNIDRNLIQFDFLVNESNPCDYDEEIRELGGEIHTIPRYKIANILPYKKACKSFFATHSYPIVHGHIGLPAPIYLSEAKRTCGFLIAHSHAQKNPLSAPELAFRISTYPTRYCADYYLACSKQAGIDLFGTETVGSNRFHILMNGIDTEAAKYSEQARASVRTELGIEQDAPVFGHVGRLTHIKNQSFLLDVFSRVIKTLPNAHLILAGRGEDEAILRNKVKSLNIEKDVHFLGVRDDIPSVLSAIDVFIFPSFKEGLANAAIEAQASGARCLLSTGVPKLARINNSTIFEPLDSGKDEWASIAVDLYAHPHFNRECAVTDACTSGFDIKKSADWISCLYLDNARRI